MSDFSDDGWDIPTSVSAKSFAPTAKKDNVFKLSDQPMTFGTAAGTKGSTDIPVSAVPIAKMEEMSKPSKEMKGFCPSKGSAAVAAATTATGFGTKTSVTNGFGPPQGLYSISTKGFGFNSTTVRVPKPDEPKEIGSSNGFPAVAGKGFGYATSMTSAVPKVENRESKGFGSFAVTAAPVATIGFGNGTSENKGFGANKGFPTSGTNRIGSEASMAFAVPNVKADEPPAQNTEAKGFGASSTSAGFRSKSNDVKGFGTSTEAKGFGASSTSAGLVSKTNDTKGFGTSAEAKGIGASSTSAGFGSKSNDVKGFGTSTEAKGFGASSTSAGFGSKSNDIQGFGISTEAKGFGASSTSAGFGSKSNDIQGFGTSTEAKGFGPSSTSAGFGSKSSDNGFGTSAGFNSTFTKGFGAAGVDSANIFGSKAAKGFGVDLRDLSKSSSGGGTKGCYNCGEEGHNSKDCSEPRKERQPQRCFNCGQEGHRSNDCSEPKKERGPLTCFKCKQIGHRNTECPNEAFATEGEAVRPKSTFVPDEVGENDLFTNHVEKGAMFDKFFDVDTQVSCNSGEKFNKKQIKNFDEAGFTETVASNIRKSNYTRPTPVQQTAIPLIMAGHDVISVAQTGSGKTAAFLLPVIHNLITANDFTPSDSVCRPRCIILSPTRELCSQIHSESRKFCSGTALSTACIYGGTSVEYAKSAISKGATILVATVGRLQHFINEGIVSTEMVKYFILDEADTMLKNESFAPCIMEIIAKMPPNDQRQTIMFSATFPTELQLLTSKILRKDYVMMTVDVIGCANKCITQEMLQCARTNKKDELLKLLNVDIKKYSTSKDNEVFNQKTIVFVESKKMTDLIGLQLCESGIPTMTIHGDRFQNQRAEAIREFTRGNIAVLVATAVAERGLDIKGVDHVINFDLPDEIDKYVHRIGRTGRVGNAGRATSLYDSEKDGALASDLVRILQQAEQIVPTFLSLDGENKCFFGPSTAGQEEDW